jgi:DNA-binding IclR family transcriptional regulator
MVERAFQLLDVLAASEAGHSLSELARQLDMSKGSVHGLLKTLESAGAVTVDDERRYTLGPRVYDLAQAYIRRSGLRRFALPAMRRLAAASGETIFLGQIESDGVRIVERMEEPGESTALRISARRGTRVHPLAGATGRVVLASWPPARRAEYLRTKALPHFTEHSIADRDAYLAAVEEAARTGIGVDQEEYLAGVNAVAAGIHGLGGELIALLWIVGFGSRLNGDALRRAGELLRDEAQAISRQLGAEPDPPGRPGA